MLGKDDIFYCSAFSAAQAREVRVGLFTSSSSPSDLVEISKNTKVMKAVRNLRAWMRRERTMTPQ